jgi:methyl-accepting chemotaxis protein
LTESLKNVFEKVKEVMKLIPGETEKQADQLNFLKSEIEKLSKISKEIVFESGLDPNNPQEAIWKSESNQRNIQKMVETISKEMQNNILNMQKTISEIQKKNSL